MNATERLLELRAKIDKAAAERQRAQGALDEAMRTLKTRFKCKTVPEAEKRLKEMDAEIEKKSKLLDEGIAELENAHEWLGGRG